MASSELTLQNGERIVFALRSLYTRYGYTSYKMSKFEDYELYARNKDFLVSDNVITFTDIGGKLMALKPDVTLSIVKNGDDLRGSVQKVYYNENVYRLSSRTHRFAELMQTGLECIGDLDDYCVGEVLMLAAKSLRVVSERAVLDLSHLGVVSSLLDCLDVDKETREALLYCVGKKNIHELSEICRTKKVDENKISLLTFLVSTYGAPKDVLPTLREKLTGVIDLSPLDELERAVAAVPSDLEAMLRLDFSVIGDLNYYNGIVFKGFVPSVPNSILSGGRYDRLMKRLGRSSGAIGFAVYMDELERLCEAPSRFDVDVLLLYDASCEAKTVRATVEILSSQGESVTAQREKNEKLRCRRVLKLNSKGEVTELENHA